LALMTVFLAGMAAAGAEPVKLFVEDDGSPGRVHELALADHNPHPDDSFFYNEAWFMIAISDNGYYGYVTFLVSNSGVAAMTPGFSFTIVTPERRRLVRDVDFKPADLKVSEGAFGLALGDNYFQATDQGYEVKVAADNLGLELTFINHVPGFKLGNGRAVFGSEGRDVFCLNYMSPRPEFTGKFLVEGKEVPVKGWGYIDHSVTLSNPADYQEVWHNFKFRSDTHTVLISSFTTPKRLEKDFGFGAVTDQSRLLCSWTEVKVTEMEVKTDPESGKPYAGRVRYEAVGDKCRVRAEMDSSDPSEKFDVLAKLDQKWWGKAVKLTINTFLAKPWYFRAVGPVEVELEFEGQVHKLQGTAFNEIIFSN
jgi:hypothetical protein